MKENSIGKRVYIQVKGTDNITLHEDNVKYRCEVKHLIYYLECQLPVNGYDINKCDFDKVWTSSLNVLIEIEL